MPANTVELPETAAEAETKSMACPEVVSAVRTCCSTKAEVASVMVAYPRALWPLEARFWRLGSSQILLLNGAPMKPPPGGSVG